MNELGTNVQRMNFCDRYFQVVQSTVVYKTDDYREYLPSLAIDKELTDRPFFWMWAEKTGQPIEPTTLRLAFSKEAQNQENDRLRQEAIAEIEQKSLTPAEKMFFRPPTCELIDCGSFRLEKIFQSVDRHGKFACVVSQDNTQNRTIVPWLCMNGLISYRCDSVEQQWFSVGVCLLSGQIIDDFFQKIEKISFHEVTSKQILADAIWKVQNAIELAKQHVKQIGMTHPNEWAIEARVRLDEEIKHLETYYQSIIPDIKEDERPLATAEFARKKANLQSLHEPKINIECKQFALIGLTVK